MAKSRAEAQWIPVFAEEEVDSILGVTIHTQIKREPRLGLVMISQVTKIDGASPVVDVVTLGPKTIGKLRAMYEALLALPPIEREKPGGDQVRDRPGPAPSPQNAERVRPAAMSREREKAIVADLVDPDRTSGLLIFQLLENPLEIIEHVETLASLPGKVFHGLRDAMMDLRIGQNGIAPEKVRPFLYGTHARQMQQLWKLVEDLNADGMKATYQGDRWERVARAHIAKWG